MREEALMVLWEEEEKVVPYPLLDECLVECLSKWIRSFVLRVGR